MIFFMQTSSAQLQRGPICKGPARITSKPIFEDAQPANQPDLYFATVEGALDPNCKWVRLGTNGEGCFRPDPGEENV